MRPKFFIWGGAGFVLGIAIATVFFLRTDKDYRDISRKAAYMEDLAFKLGNLLEEERIVRIGLKETVSHLESNLRAAADRTLDLEIGLGELSIRYRELEAALAGIGGELSGTVIDITGVADDIESIIGGLEESQAEEAP